MSVSVSVSLSLSLSGRQGYSGVSEQAAVMRVTLIRGREIAGRRKMPTPLWKRGTMQGGNYRQSLQCESTSDLCERVRKNEHS